MSTFDPRNEERNFPVLTFFLRPQRSNVKVAKEINVD